MASKEIQIIDVGLGNILSIKRMIEKVGGQSRLVSRSTDLDLYGKYILPGVGHFDEGMRRLGDKGFVDCLTDPLMTKNLCGMGICLGMQLLCKSSEEGQLPGLGLVDATVEKIKIPDGSKYKVPHMGWNSVLATQSNPLLPQIADEQRFYFVHSYKVVPRDATIVIGSTNYLGRFCSAFQKETLFGVQFHPEKSHRFGFSLMKRFVEM